MRKIPFYIESENGHDTEQVSEDKVQERVEEELEKDKWVTVENKDGSSEILTKDDVPISTDEETPSDPKTDVGVDDNDAWKQTFANGKPQASTCSVTRSSTATAKKKWDQKFTSVQSATATHKAKGG